MAGGRVTDGLARYALTEAEARELFVRDVFVADAYIVDSAEPLDQVLERMTAEHIGSALITKAGKLVGIFTPMDACRILYQHLRSLFPSKSGNDVA